MSLTSRLVETNGQINAVTRELTALRSALVGMTEDFATAERLAEADVDEFGIHYARICELKLRAQALLKKRRELNAAVARESG